MDADDALDLAILRMHHNGTIDRQIARKLGVSRQKVSQRRIAILRDDCLHDPTAHAYWRLIKETPT